MLIKRFPAITVALVLTITLLSVALSHVMATDASTLSPNPPPIHNHPSIYDTDGEPTIPAHKDGTLLTVADVQHYVLTHPFPAGPVVSGAQLKIEVLQLVTSQQASILMGGEYIGLPDNARVYYVVVKGPFILAGISVISGFQGPNRFESGEEVFDAKTGNRLVWGIRG